MSGTGVVVSWKQPSHPGLLEVVDDKHGRGKGAISLVSLPPGAHFASFTTATTCPAQTWTSVQSSSSSSDGNTHLELNSDLVFCNHSCRPTLVFDMRKGEARVTDGRALDIGDELTFFYPSTEWEMVQPFVCKCAATWECGAWIAGAKHTRAELLERCWLNEHIRDRLAIERPGVMSRLRGEV